MKTIIAILLIIIGAGVYYAFKSDDATATEVVVIRDITDAQITQPKAKDIIPLFDLNNFQWNGAKFRYVDITNVSYNRTFETSVKEENEWMGNEFERKKKVNGFYTDVSRIFSEKNSDTIGKENSIVYLPIARELNRLSKSTSEKKIMIIYSDLMENTKSMSFYDNKALNLIRTDPDSIKKYFETQLPLESLRGIIIYIIYQPTGIKEDEQFKIVSGFYKTILESKSAQIEITANLN